MTPPTRLEVGMSGRAGSRPDDPLGVFVVADLTGDAPAPGNLVRVSLENLDSVIAKLNPQIELAQGQIVAFQELEDFHPDQLCRTIPYISGLRRLLKQLRSSSEFNSAIEEMRTLGLLSEAPPEPEHAEDSTPENDQGGIDFERLLGAPASSNVAEASPKNPSLERMLGPIVAPHLVHGDVSARQTECIDLVSERIAEALRAVLQDARFQQLETAWRGLHWLLSQLDTGAELHCFVFSANSAGLSNLLSDTSVNLASVIRSSMDTYGLHSDRACVVVDTELDSSDIQIELAGQLGLTGQHIGVPVFTGAADSIAALREPEADLEQAAAWNRLRQQPQSQQLVAAWPRFLARYPYGDNGEPIDTFEFEELGDPLDPAGLVWCNGAFLSAVAFASELLGHHRGQFSTEGIPVISYCLDGDTWVVATTQSAVVNPEGLISATGLCPLVGSRNRSQIVVPWLGSISA